MRMILKTILFGCLLFSGLSFSQKTTLTSLQLEQKADSIYFNKSDYYSEKDYHELRKLREQVLSSYKDTLSVSYKIALSKKHAADALQFQFQIELDSALKHSKKAEYIYNKVGGRDLLFKGHLQKYLFHQYYNIKDFDNALLASKHVLNIFKDTLSYNHKLIAEAEFDYGHVLGRFGDYNKVIEQYKKAINLNISNTGEYTRSVAIQEHHLALVYGFIGYSKKELESYKKVVKRWEHIRDKDMSYLSVAYSSLSIWYMLHGDIKTAEQYILKNQALISTHKTNIKNWINETYKGRTQVELWRSLATLALHKKDTAKAFLYNDKILNFVTNFDANDKSNNPHNLSYFKHFVDLNHIKALRFKANLIKAGQPDKANALNEQVLIIEGNPVVATTTLNEKLNILDYHIDTKAFTAAAHKLKTYMALAKSMKSDYVLMHLFSKAADLSIAEGDFHQIDASYEQAFKKLQKDSLHPIAINDLKYKACKPYGDKAIVSLVLSASKNYSKAYTETEKKEDLEKAHNLSVLSSNMFSENFSYLPYNPDSYKTIISINEQLLNTAVLLQNNIALNDVLETIEQTNSRLSWKKFLGSKQRRNLNIPDSILERESNLKSELHFYKKKLSIDTKNTEDKVKLFKEKMYDIEIEIERLEDWYNINYPSYFNQTQKEFTIESLKQKLKKKQRIIKYIIAEKHIYAFAITSETTKLIKLGDKVTFNKKIETLINTLTTANSEDYKMLAQDLYKLLLPKAVLINNRKQDLIFIQDDILNFVPMEILLDAKNKYLIENHTVSYAPSLLLWEEQLKVKKAKKTKLGIFVPTYKKQKSNDPKRNDESKLLGANAEAIKIGKLFNSDIYSGEKATKQKFIDNAQAYSILHLAMHSTINNTEAEFSNLSFSSEDSEKLFVSELYNIPLNADLAVLSACNTGSGKLDKGEGLTNVSKAFTYAGVPSIVMSLWEVPDKETSQIMIAFYNYLKEGNTKNKALQLAKLEYLNSVEDNVLKHPFYWAGFVISGDVSAIQTQSNNKIIAVLMILFLVGLFVSRKRLIKLFK